ncbi:MAG: hypothetical protein ACKPKO_17875, partial [Candidatus Fonsibacter sp.]
PRAWRGNARLPPAHPNFASLRRLHELVVQEKCLPELVAAVKNPKRSPRLTSSLAASFLTADHGIGTYLAKHVIATMLSQGFIDFDVTVVGPGSLATVTYLCGKSATSSRARAAAGLLPNDTDKDLVRGTVAHLAQLE